MSFSEINFIKKEILEDDVKREEIYCQYNENDFEDFEQIDAIIKKEPQKDLPTNSTIDNDTIHCGKILMDTFSNNLVFVCFICGENFVDKAQEFKRHILTIHMNKTCEDIDNESNDRICTKNINQINIENNTNEDNVNIENVKNHDMDNEKKEITIQKNLRKGKNRQIKSEAYREKMRIQKRLWREKMKQKKSEEYKEKVRIEKRLWRQKKRQQELEKSNIICEICNMKFLSERNKIIHKETGHKTIDLFETLAFKMLDDNNQLNDHNFNVNDNESYKQQLNNTVEDTVSENVSQNDYDGQLKKLKRKIKQVERAKKKEELNIICKICNRKFVSENRKALHEETYHKKFDTCSTTASSNI